MNDTSLHQFISDTVHDYVTVPKQVYVADAKRDALDPSMLGTLKVDVKRYLGKTIDGWHTGASQGLQWFKSWADEPYKDEIDWGFWISLIGSFVGATWGAVAAIKGGLIGLAISTVGDLIGPAEGKSPNQIYNELIEALNDARTKMEDEAMLERYAVLAANDNQIKTAYRKGEIQVWTQRVRLIANAPDGDINAIKRRTEVKCLLDLWDKITKDVTIVEVSSPPSGISLFPPVDKGWGELARQILQRDPTWHIYTSKTIKFSIGGVIRYIRVGDPKRREAENIVQQLEVGL